MNYVPKSVFVFGIIIFVIFQNSTAIEVEKGSSECNPEITCDTFDLLNSTSCSSQFLELYDAVDARHKFCGRNAPKVSSSSSILIAHYKAEVHESDEGFRCSVACTPPNRATSHFSLLSTRKKKPKAKACGESGSKGSKKPGDRIIGGEDTTWEQYPWHASLESYGSNLCGASLIAPNPWNDQINDVSVITLASPFEGTTICIPPPGAPYLDKYADQLGTLTGWGLLGSGQPQPLQLQRLVLPLNTWENCKAAHGSRIHESQSCFGALEGGKGQCRGDTGGPLVVAGDDGKYFQNGVVSWTVKPCGIKGYPGVFVRITDEDIQGFIKSCV